jgi:hypothetical protein
MSTVWRAERYAQRRAHLDRIKLSRGCEDPRCAGYPEHPSALQFDHRDPSEKHRTYGGMSRMLAGAKWELVVAEIAKCDVVCANCHAVRTAEADRYHHRL